MSNVKIISKILPGDRIKVERHRLKHTQAEMAALCGVERETWSRYESGKLAMGQDVFRKFQEAGADADFLTTGIARAVYESFIAVNNGAEPIYTQLTPRQKALLDNYDALSEEARRNIEGTLDLLAKSTVKKRG